MVGNATADLTINYDFTPNTAVPDYAQQDPYLSDVRTLGGLSGLTTFSNVVTRLNLTSANSNDPMWLGDMYSSLTFGTSSETQRIAVLLNRPGVNNSDPFGSGLSTLNVTLDNSASTNVWGTTSSSGTYLADGRLSVNPYGNGVAFASGSNGLDALNGTHLTSDRVSLLVADTATGGTATLSGWGVSVSGTAASSGSFTPGANASISDTTGANNNVGAKLDTTGANSAAGGTLKVDLSGTTTFTNGVTGSGGLYKTGAGKLVLAGTIDYSGITTVNGGSLAVNGTSTGTGAVTVNNAGTKLMGNGTVGGNTTINSGATLAPGNNSVGQENFTHDLTLNTGSIFEWEIDRTQTQTRGIGYDAVDVSGTLSGAGAVFRIVIGDSAFDQMFWSTNRTWSDIFNGSRDLASIFSGGFQYSVPLASQGSFTWDTNSTLKWTPQSGATFVPEPSTALAGLLLAAGLLRRRR